MSPSRIACFFATSGHSGVDRAMQHLIPEWARRGYEVDLLHVRRHGPVLKELPEGVRVIDLGTRHTYSSLFPLVRYLRANRPEVMLSDKDRVNRTALLAHTLARVPTRLYFSFGTTVSVDLATRDPLDRWIQRNSMGHLYQFAKKVIVTSEGVADDMASYTGLERERIEVVPSPVVPDALLTTNLAPPDHPWYRAGEPPVLVSVGELAYRKDFPTLLRAFARVRSRHACRLVIVGEGKERPRLLALARELGVAQDVDLIGFKADPYPYMAHARLFAFASRWEGLGFVIIEALALGTPVVSTDCPSGPREILKDGVYGRLVPVGDDEGMASAIEQTLAEPCDPRHLRNAVRPYTISASTDAYLRTMELRPDHAPKG